VEALWTYVSERLEKNFRRTVFAVPQPSHAVPSMPGAPRGAGGFGRRVIGS
jgi:chromosome partitioning protein